MIEASRQLNGNTTVNRCVGHLDDQVASRRRRLRLKACCTGLCEPAREHRFLLRSDGAARRPLRGLFARGGSTEVVREACSQVDLGLLCRPQHVVPMFEKIVDLQPGTPFPTEYHEVLKRLWKDEGVQTVMRNGSEHGLPEKYALVPPPSAPVTLY